MSLPLSLRLALQLDRLFLEMQREEFVNLTSNLLSYIERSQDSSLKRETIRWTASIDGSVGKVLQEGGLEIPDKRTGDIIFAHRGNLSYLYDIIRDLGGTGLNLMVFQ